MTSIQEISKKSYKELVITKFFKESLLAEELSQKKQ